MLIGVAAVLVALWQGWIGDAIYVLVPLAAVVLAGAVLAQKGQGHSGRHTRPVLAAVGCIENGGSAPVWSRGRAVGARAIGYAVLLVVLDGWTIKAGGYIGGALLASGSSERSRCWLVRRVGNHCGSTEKVRSSSGCPREALTEAARTGRAGEPAVGAPLSSLAHCGPPRCRCRVDGVSVAVGPLLRGVFQGVVAAVEVVHRHLFVAVLVERPHQDLFRPGLAQSDVVGVVGGDGLQVLFVEVGCQGAYRFGAALWIWTRASAAAKRASRSSLPRLRSAPAPRRRRYRPGHPLPSTRSSAEP